VVFPRITRGRPANETIRVWVAGCATGEEAFSIGIALQEYMAEAGASWPVQIFASDISLVAIEKARTGTYLENIAAEVSTERLNRYFTRVEGGYRVGKKLREMCVFTRHNLIEDPPFSKVDLVSCRNVLIYLGSVQKHIIPMFHYALRPGGLLMLGSSEAAGFQDLFSVADADRRIYSRRETARKPFLFSAPSRGPRWRGAQKPVPAAPGPMGDVWDEMDARKQVDRILLSKYTPAGVVVDENLEVIEIRGKASPYLSLPGGRPSFNLVKLIPDTGLFLGIEKLIHQTQQNGEPARQERIPHDFEGAAGSLNVEVIPLTSGHKFSALVLLEPVPARPGENGHANPTPSEAVRDLQIDRLKQQLGEARHRFEAAMEEHQASREESQNTTEEALSANEEMQSLNEELETAKEELQSINEELITINDEMQAKNAALAQARDFAMSIVETVHQPLLVLDTNLRIKMANGAFYRTFQTLPADAEGQHLYTLSRGSWDMPRLRNALEGLLQDDQMFPDLEVEQDFPGAGRRSLVLTGCHLNPLKMILLAVDDVTERERARQVLRKTEENLRQSQKMEAVGRLAGGIAHDFNNLLTVVIGYSSLLGDTFARNETAVVQIGEINKAAERAAALTEQLLAFSRRQVLRPKVLEPNAIVHDFGTMLQRLVSERIKVSIGCDNALWKVRADPGEIGRALMNLALNARDAMPDGGALTIKTENVTRISGDEANAAPELGRYVAISVQDTGTGMTADVREHIFEPFYTTKEIGKGTGLGLATVLGIVEQSGGAIRCDSTPGVGTTFTIFLPAVVAAADKAELVAGGLELAPRGSEVILLVDDEENVRVLAGKVLQASGYTVYEMRDGREGLEFCESHKGRIDLLVSDVVMPDLGGRELAEGALKLRPDMRVMFMSGHTEDVTLKEGVQTGMSFIQKPFTPVALARKVRETLDAAADAKGRVIGAA
jgi:two-component system CheB/CheR fusion protein